MPGIAGIVDPNGCIDLKQLLWRMLNVMKHENFHIIRQYVDPPVALGKVYLENMKSVNSPIFNKDEYVLLMNGEIYTPIDAEGILSLYEQVGEHIATFLNGLFTLCILDKKKRKLIIINDPYGLRPIYYTLRNGRFLFASEVKAILEDHEIPRILDNEAVADFFAFGYLLGNRTLIQKINTLSPGSVLVVNLHDATFKVSSILDLKSPEYFLSKVYCIEQLYKILKRVMSEQIKNDEQVGVELSGGIDSRLIMAGIEPHRLKQIHAFTYGMKNCEDKNIAKMVAESLGVDWNFYELKPEYLLRSAEKVVYITDGMAMFHHSHGLYELFRKELRSKFDVVLNGIGGELLHGGYLKYEFITLEPRDLPSLVLNSIADEEALDKHKTFFSEMYYTKVKTLPIKHIEIELSGAPFFSPANKVDYFFLRNRVKRMSLGFLIRNNFFEFRVPLIHLVNYVFAIPPQLRLNAFIVKTLFITKFPKLAIIPYQRELLPLNANRLRRKIKTISMFLSDAFKNHISRLTQGKILFVNHHPFIDHNYLFRTDLRDFVEDILLDSKTLSRPYFNSNKIEKLVKEHMTARKNLADQLGKLITFELWHRMFIDNYSEN
jgi:asparagine synthase (glutamine-hydrolysing)